MDQLSTDVRAPLKTPKIKVQSPIFERLISLFTTQSLDFSEFGLHPDVLDGIQTLKLSNVISFAFQDDLGRVVSNGIVHNYSLGITLARNSINDPIFPKQGSLISMKMNATPPYSLFKDGSFY